MAWMYFSFCFTFAIGLLGMVANVASCGQLYLLQIELTGNNLLYHINRTNTGQMTSGEAQVIHRFKVVGQDELLLVLEEGSLNSVDKFLESLLPFAIKVKSCTPLLAYETFANYLEVSQPEGEPKPLTPGRFFWMEFTVTHPELTTAELMSLWAKESAAALAVTRQSELRPYKVVGERKIQAFIKFTAEQVDDMSWTLPMMVENGHGTTIVTKAVTKF